MVTTGPCVLEIEATSDAVYVHDFSCEVEALVEFAFHRFEIDLFELNSSAGDEFIFVEAFAVYVKF